jgi:hypothetical protein
VEDPNELGARLIKAEIMGDEELIKSLKVRLEKARAVADAKKAEQKANNNNNNYNRHGNNSQSNQKGHGHGKGRHHNNNNSNNSYKSSKHHDPMVSDVMKRNYKHSSVNDEYDELGGATSSKKIDKDVQFFVLILKIEKKTRFVHGKRPKAI